eukprot:CAMPEP_0180805892 /NCGR_PEP_ID=MMETSP1038_2-20121128/62281_1 /TAXON_ID=632150 /ORGANISM="Azadinium spinosum, Strain 3D9" /LENGTH=49 /DNA_ID=CAMNT_0022846521 /DNA_START=42 /DNA_END=191 /DNA_ORIENTATION=+
MCPCKAGAEVLESVGSMLCLAGMGHKACPASNLTLSGSMQSLQHPQRAA